jgi:hypothetical protein
MFACHGLLVLTTIISQPATGIDVRVAELYDPANVGFVATDAIHDHRFVHTATLLDDGNVLIAAGTNGSRYLASAETYDPRETCPSPGMGTRRHVLQPARC